MVQIERDLAWQTRPSKIVDSVKATALWPYLRAESPRSPMQWRVETGWSSRGFHILSERQFTYRVVVTVLLIH